MTEEDIYKIVSILKEEYQIGNSSIFCDDSDWDEASEEEIIYLLKNRLKNVQAKD